MPKPTRITKAQAMKALGITNNTKLAAAVVNATGKPFTRQGVSRWGEHDFIPVDKQLALHQKHPRKVPMPVA